VLTYVGDGNNVAHSLLLAGAKVGVESASPTPRATRPDAASSPAPRARRRQRAARWWSPPTPVAAVTGAHAVYTDVWASMGQEARPRPALAVFAPYQVTAELFAHAADDAVFLHCLPAHRGEEVTAEVIDGPASRVFDQAENRLHAQKALLVRLLAER
jgi:ornithine carbamoyltransferase